MDTLETKKERREGKKERKGREERKKEKGGEKGKKKKEEEEEEDGKEEEGRRGVGRYSGLGEEYKREEVFHSIYQKTLYQPLMPHGLLE